MTVLLVVVAVVGVLLARSVHSKVWTLNAWPTRVHLAAAWSLIMLGLVHIAATTIFYSTLSSRALWFASGGIAMSLAGALNALQRLYARLAPGISITCIAANVATSILAGAFVWLAGTRIVREPQFLLLLTLVLVGTALSVQAAASEKPRRDARLSGS